MKQLRRESAAPGCRCGFVLAFRGHKSHHGLVWCTFGASPRGMAVGPARVMNSSMCLQSGMHGNHVCKKKNCRNPNVALEPERSSIGCRRMASVASMCSIITLGIVFPRGRSRRAAWHRCWHKRRPLALQRVAHAKRLMMRFGFDSLSLDPRV